MALNCREHCQSVPSITIVYGGVNFEDEAMWVEAIDKEVIKCFTMGTWQIVDTADIPPECNIMGTCFSFKVKSNYEGNFIECRARANANGTQQKPDSYGKTSAPSNLKFSIQNYSLSKKSPPQKGV